MKFYYSGKSPDIHGVIMIHADDCKSLPDVLNRVYLGIFPNGNLATSSAIVKLQLSKVNICSCCN
ncbi:hypothetical protein [Gramella sp. MAR_2010_147]|uniref:hypothetical protein n=1 Tax=Gramella sp. MAR_2010_147 TaxID=1250205 RepID=UPI00087C1703|nr:hypothetical protein [Gramella sp. MAR_2010_147]SDS13127.1 hypothetical protein SAMN04488553_1545 [Gramella sp. MAR_2010_147]